MNISALKELTRENKQLSKKQKRREKKRKFCSKCGTERTMRNKDSFTRGVCHPCLVDWEEEQEDREVEIRQRIVDNQTKYRIEREDERERRLWQ